MIDLPADIEDRAAYPLVAESERWIFNKLILAEKLGHRCAPSGTDVAEVGPVCRRPIMNVAGNAMGGVIKHEVMSGPQGFEQPAYAAGYFWCEWFDGYHEWIDFTDDIAVRWWGGVEANGMLDNTEAAAPQFATLPTLLQGLSKHLVVEHIGGNIIEIAPRHMTLSHGIAGGRMIKIRVTPPWGNNTAADVRNTFYWRVIPRP